jgi:processing peptidase subunit alpha
MYQSSHFHSATPLALSLIADTVLNPAFLAEELEAQRDAAFYELRELNAKPDMILPEILHNIAYGGKGLGNPLLCQEDRITTINEPMLRSYMKEWYRPERMVIAAAGVQHQELVELVYKYFPSVNHPMQNTSIRPNVSQPQPQLQPHLISSSSPTVGKSLTRAASYLFPNSLSATMPSPPPVSTSTTYTGGHRFIRDTSQEFNHLYVAFEGVGIHDDDIYALATMQVLLGGGGSFSAGKTI